MKLIDLDEIEYFTLVDKFGTPRYKIEVGDGLPIVKAIPVEWIKKYMDKVDIEDCGMVYLSPSAPFREMLKEWERENETN